MNGLFLGSMKEIVSGSDNVDGIRSFGSTTDVQTACCGVPAGQDNHADHN